MRPQHLLQSTEWLICVAIGRLDEPVFCHLEPVDELGPTLCVAAVIVESPRPESQPGQPAVRRFLQLN